MGGGGSRDEALPRNAALGGSASRDVPDGAGRSGGGGRAAEPLKLAFPGGVWERGLYETGRAIAPQGD